MGGYIELGGHIDKLNEKIAEMKGSMQPIEDLNAVTVLMVDPGEYTLDWLLLQNGSLTSKASGAASDAGRHRVVRAVHEALQDKIGRPLGPATMTRINEALRLNLPLKLSGVAYDLLEFEPIIKAVVADPISRLIDGMRSMHEFVDVIVLVGGHPERCRDVLEERFPQIPVFIVQPAVEANVRGFQIIGEATAAAAADISRTGWRWWRGLSPYGCVERDPAMSALNITVMVDEDVHPELFRALLSVKNIRFRSERLRVLATMGLRHMNESTNSQTEKPLQVVDPEQQSSLIVPMEVGKVKTLQHPVSPADKSPDARTDFQPQAVDSKGIPNLIVAMGPEKVKELVAPAETQKMHLGMKLAMQMARRGEFGTGSAPSWKKSRIEEDPRDLEGGKRPSGMDIEGRFR